MTCSCRKGGWDPCCERHGRHVTDPPPIVYRAAGKAQQENQARQTRTIEFNWSTR